MNSQEHTSPFLIIALVVEHVRIKRQNLCVILKHLVTTYLLEQT